MKAAIDRTFRTSPYLFAGFALLLLALLPLTGRGAGVQAALSRQVNQAATLFTIPGIASWQMVSSPFTLSRNFQQLGIYAAKLDPTANTYNIVPTPPADQFQIGQGYWVYTTTNVPLPGPGTPANQNSAFSIPIKAGWNQIGTPFYAAIPLSSVTYMPNNAQSMAAANAITAAKISPLYQYVPAANQYNALANSTQSMMPYVGYWIFTFVDASLVITPPTSNGNLSGVMQVGSFAVPAGTVSTVTGNTTILSTGNVQIDGTVIVNPGASFSVISQGTLNITGVIQPAPPGTSRQAVSRQSQSRPSPDVYSGPDGGITGDVFAAPGQDIMIATLPTGNSASTATNNLTISGTVSAGDGAPGTNSNTPGQNGGSIEIGTSGAIQAANSQSGGFVQLQNDTPDNVFITGMLRAGDGGAGYTDATGQGTLVLNCVGSNGGKGGDINIVATASISPPGAQIKAGNGGAGGGVMKPDGSPVAASDGAAGQPGQDIAITTGNGGNGGGVALSVGSTQVSPVQGGTPGIGGNGGSATARAGNGGAVATGGHTNITTGLPGSNGTGFGLPAGQLSTPHSGTYSFSDGGNGGPGTATAAGGDGGVLVFSPVSTTLNGVQTTVPPAIENFIISNYGNGGPGFSGCPGKGTNGGDAAQPIALVYNGASAKQSNTRTGSFNGGKGGDGNPFGTGGAGGKDDKGVSVGADGANGNPCPTLTTSGTTTGTTSSVATNGSTTTALTGTTATTTSTATTTGSTTSGNTTSGSLPQLPIIATVPVGKGPADLVVNSQTNKIYVANAGDGTLSIVDGASLTSTQVPVEPNLSPLDLAINPAANTVYVGLSGGAPGNAIVDGSSGNVIKFMPTNDPASGNSIGAGIGRKVYNNGKLYCESANGIAVVDATTLQPLHYDGAVPFSLFPNDASGNSGYNLAVPAVDSSTGKLYVPLFQGNVAGSAVAVIDPDAQTQTGVIGVGQGPYGIAVNPGTHKVYVANKDSNTVSVIDANTLSVTATIPVQKTPLLIAVNPTTNLIFVGDRDISTLQGHITVIDGGSNQVVGGVTLQTGELLIDGLAADPARNRVYVTIGGGSITGSSLGTNTVFNTLTVLDSSVISSGNQGRALPNLRGH